MTKDQYLAIPCVEEFVSWLHDLLPQLQIKLRITPSRFVPGGLVKDVVGVEAVTECYRWRAYWDDANGETHLSETWLGTREGLTYLSDWLRQSLAENDNDATLNACKQILTWGGVLRARHFPEALAREGRLVDYLLSVREAMALQNPLTSLSALEPIIQRFDSGLTKIHALASTDGLPIYDSRVGAAITGLRSLFERECEHLRFPTGAARGRQIRNPGELSGHRLAPQFYTRQVSHARWAQAQVKLGWLFERVLEDSNLYGQEESLPARMHALEAAFFLIGYDLRSLRGFSAGENPEEISPVLLKSQPQSEDELVLFGEPLEGGFVPTSHNFHTVIRRYWGFRSEHPENLSLPDFTSWLRQKYGLAHNTALAYCYPLRASQFDIAVLSNETIRALVENPDGELSEQFLKGFCDGNIQEMPTCLMDTFIVGTLAQNGNSAGQTKDKITEMGFAGTNNAANTLQYVGRWVGRHFKLLGDDDSPTKRFHQLFA